MKEGRMKNGRWNFEEFLNELEIIGGRLSMVDGLILCERVAASFIPPEIVSIFYPIVAGLIP